jgi:putative CocE/NonD family hydrolase
MRTLVPVCLLLSLPAFARENFASVALETVMVPMRDGAKLATDLYRPGQGGKPAAGRFPVLIERTPYNKIGRRKLGDFLARRGYAVVLQDSRGRYGSEGEFHPFVEEGKDGYDAIEWAAAQPWCDGRVGSFGGSYTGIDQYAAAVYRPPHLAGMFVQMAGASIYESVSYPGGAPGADWLSWLMRSATSSPLARDHKDAAEAIDRMLKNDLRTWLFEPPRKRGEILSDFPVHARFYQDIYDHPAYDTYWKQSGWSVAGHYAEVKDVPIMFVTGWYDIFMQGTLDVYMALAKIQKSEKKLLVGPWPHGIGTPVCGDAIFDGPNTIEDQAALVGDWFDYVLRNEKPAILSPEPVQIYRMRGGDGSRDARGKLKMGGEWLTAPAWPTPSSHPGKYYLRAGGALDTTAPAGEEPARFEFDPLHPVPTRGGRANALPGSPNCVQNIASMEKRADVLTFSTAPLALPLELTGRVRVRLWISSDRPDTDFTAWLADVYPDGYASLVADGALRVRYRNSFEKPERMEPGKPYEITVDLGSTSKLFEAGHRLRIAISSSSFPRIEPNPNTGDFDEWNRRPQKAHNAVYHDRVHASYVELPVVR